MLRIGLAEEAMKQNNGKLFGIIEADETFADVVMKVSASKTLHYKTLTR